MLIKRIGGPVLRQRHLKRAFSGLHPPYHRQSTTTATSSTGARLTGTGFPFSNRCSTLSLPNTFHAVACRHKLGHHVWLGQFGTIMHIHALSRSARARHSAIKRCGGKQRFHSHSPLGCSRQSCCSAKADGGATASGSHCAAVYRAHFFARFHGFRFLPGHGAPDLL